MFLETDDRGWLVGLQPYGRTWSKRLDVTYIRGSQVKIPKKRQRKMRTREIILRLVNRC